VKVREMQSLLNMGLAAGGKGMDREIAGGYCGDLLSDVMAHSNQGEVWMTIQSHQNIVAVAVLKELAAIVLVNGRAPDGDTTKKAEEEGIPILLSPLTAYQVCGQLYELGIGRV